MIAINTDIVQDDVERAVEGRSTLASRLSEEVGTALVRVSRFLAVRT